MSTRRQRSLLLLLCLTALTLRIPTTQAEAPPVELSATLAPTGPVVPGQRVRLTLTLATPRWFTAGTRLRLPEASGAIILQNQEFATNATERRDGATWTRQSWSLDVFATRTGTIRLPPVIVEAQVSISPGKNQALTLQSPPLSLEVALPDELAGLDHWIASPKVTLSATQPERDEVTLGAAVKRQVVVKAVDVMAMALPRIEAVTDPLLQTYREPPVLRNRANRGQLEAERRETTTWIASQPGTTTLPGITIHWWNTETRELQVLTTPALSLTISEEAQGTTADSTIWLHRGLQGLAGLLCLVLAVYLLRLLGRSPAGDRCKSRLARLMQKQRELARQLAGPALPDRLNPGGSRELPSATEPHEP